MGQKVNPISFRLQINKNWRSQWFAKKSDFAQFLQKDLKARAYIVDKFGLRGAINKIIIERRSGNTINIIIYTARVGVIIGRNGINVQTLSNDLRKIYKQPIKVNVEEIKRYELFGKLVAENIAQQLQRRSSFRRVIKNAVSETMAAGALGVKVQLNGRVANSNMSRKESEVLGSVPLNKLRSDIDYGTAQAQVPGCGIIGVKVWINKGEIL